MSIFVTATGTDQGKTYASRLLCKQLTAQGKAVQALKPILSGFDAAQPSDSSYLLQACGLEADLAAITRITPWRFEAPISPDQAATLEGKEINFDELVAFCKGTEGFQPHLIEGAGGIMSPITRRHTNLDLAVACKLPVLLVSALYLGCISHILTAIAVLEAENLSICGLVLNAPSGDAQSYETVIASLQPQLPEGLNVFHLPFCENFDQNWNQQPDLTTVSSWK